MKHIASGGPMFFSFWFQKINGYHVCKKILSLKIGPKYFNKYFCGPLPLLTSKPMRYQWNDKSIVISRTPSATGWLISTMVMTSKSEMSTWPSCYDFICWKAFEFGFYMLVSINQSETRIVETIHDIWMANVWHYESANFSIHLKLARYYLWMIGEK